MASYMVNKGSDTDYLSFVHDERFKTQTLIEIYDEAKSTDLDSLLKVAAQKFPDCLNAPRPPIYVVPAAGRAFDCGDSVWERPTHFIGGWMGDGIYIMKDGTAHPA